jgi:enterochelin esterase-like enzyme
MRWIFLIVLIIITGCTPLPAPTPTRVDPTTTRSPASADAAAEVPAGHSAPTAQSTPTPACSEKTGRITEGIIEDDDRLTRELEYRVYLPPCYDQNADGGYPVLYLLHGIQQTDAIWEEMGLVGSADRVMRDGDANPFIIVMPWEKTGLDIEPAVADVLIPYIDSHFNTCTVQRCRSIGGISRGAGWALHIGLQQPYRFTSIGLHSPATFDHEVYLARWIQQVEPADLPVLWLDIGDRDTLLPEARALMNTLESLNLDLTSSIRTGYHEKDYWRANLDDYLEWYAGTFS